MSVDKNIFIIFLSIMKLIYLKKYKSDLSIEELNFTLTPFWIKISSFLFGLFNKKKC